jgi:hypothetical protein
MVDSQRPPLFILRPARLDELDELPASERIPFRLTEPPPSGVELVIAPPVGEAVDWSNVTPHPALAELDALCVCGARMGDHEPGRVYADCDGAERAAAADLVVLADYRTSKDGAK